MPHTVQTTTLLPDGNCSRYFTRLSFVFVLMMISACFTTQAQDVRISEAMSSNGGVARDEDGDQSDWLELYNTTDTAINLDGWYLTDNDSDPTQWRLPAVTIGAKEVLLIFASNKERDDPASELHTNFKLSASGDYLALIRPDGVTVEDELTLPELPENASYGYGFPTTSAAVVFDQGAPCSALIPTAEVAGWTEPGFDDSGWLTGMTGVGLETATSGTLYTDLIGLDVVAMRGVNGSVFVRVPFDLTDAKRVNGLILRMKYEDAFVAYLNGTEVTRSESVPEPLLYDSLAESSRSDSLAVEFEEFDLTANGSMLEETGNVLAIHGMNSTVSSNDLIIVPGIEVGFAGEINTSSRGQLQSATPGGLNTEVVFTGFVEKPEVSIGRGFYEEPIEVTATTATAGATIRYTVDGSEPTAESDVFPASLMIQQSTNLRVRGFLDGSRPSTIETNTYFFLDDVVAEPRRSRSVNGQVLETGLDQRVVDETYRDASGEIVTVQDALRAIPTLSITTDSANLYDRRTGIYVNATEKWERPASVEWIEPDGKSGFQIDAGLRIRGGFSRNPQFAKHSFRLFFRDEYGKGRLEYDFFDDGGVTSFKKMDLRTNQAGSWAGEDNPNQSFLRDICFRDSSAAMGDPATRSQWCHIYLNKQYWGMYMTEERPEENYGADHFGGHKDDYDLVKIWRPYDNQPPGVGFWLDDPPPAGTLDAYQRLHTAFLDGFASNEDYFAVQGMDAVGERDFSKERLLDVENMINFLIGIWYAAAVDNGITWFTGQDNILNNLYGLYNRENPDGFKWIQHDGEISYDRVERLYATKLDRTGPFASPQLRQFRYFNPQTLHDKLVENPEYRLKVADLAYKHLKGSGALVRARSEERLDWRASQIDRAIVAHSARWGSTRLDRDSWAASVVRQRAFLGRMGDRGNEVIEYLRADGLIPNVLPPLMSHEEGEVPRGTMLSLVSSVGTIYYTTDGTDPRAVGGAVQGAAYTDPLVINDPVHVKARVFDGTEWSALTEATFITPMAPLLITEVMYHAANDGNHEFIEIHNMSTQAVSLVGYEIRNAVTADLGSGDVTSIGPGESMVVVENLAGFNGYYSDPGIVVAAEYDGSLSNGGERIELSFYGQPLISFRYNDARDWPQAADGAGHSLVPRDSAVLTQEDGSLDYGGNWRASTAKDGSPGRADVAPVRTIVLNEITAHTMTGMAPPFDSNDEIELFNTTTSPVSLAGWHLTDDPDNLEKWAIPAGTVVPASGYVVFDENDFHPGRTSGFGLSKTGEQVYLVSPDGVVDSVRFKGQALGASWGRFPDGADNWVPTSLTPSAANQLQAPTIRITELMYHPLSLSGSELEYIQLENVSDGPVTLASATGPFRIDGGVAYTFPAGTVLAAGEKLWVVPFDPANMTLREAFALSYGLDPVEADLFGPYEGALNNGGERVALESPQNPDLPEEISWIVIDELFYFDQAPWPTSVAGTGAPLVRTSATEWAAGMPADADDDGTPDSWEQFYFGTITPANSDADGDGQDNNAEFLANTDPTDASSVLSVLLNERTLNWTPRPDRVYTISWSEDLEMPFEPLATDLRSGQYLDDRQAQFDKGFYRLEVSLE